MANCSFESEMQCSDQGSKCAITIETSNSKNHNYRAALFKPQECAFPIHIHITASAAHTFAVATLIDEWGGKPKL